MQDAPSGGLAAFARSVNAKHYGPPNREKGEQPGYWRPLVEKFIGRGEGTVHVNMDGLRDGFAEMAKRGLRPALYEASATDEEMSWIARSVVNGQRSWSSVKFYQGRKELPMPMPDWSSMMGMRHMDEPLYVGRPGAD